MILNYFSKKNEKSSQAVTHTKEMLEKYAKEIDFSKRNTIIYTKEVKDLAKRTHIVPQNTVLEMDSVSAILKYGADSNSGKIAVLNFASYKNPGGMFLEGSIAQEECLCHESFLYNVLKEFPEYYEYNNQHKNKALYTNRCLYSKDIFFERDNASCKCDVITCAAPNFTTASKYCNVTEKENSKALRERIKFVLDIAEDNKVDTLILGAYGAGVFGQSAEEVATLFKNIIESENYGFSKIVYAIIPGPNVDPFKKIFGK